MTRSNAKMENRSNSRFESLESQVNQLFQMHHESQAKCDERDQQFFDNFKLMEEMMKGLLQRSGGGDATSPPNPNLGSNGRDKGPSVDQASASRGVMNQNNSSPRLPKFYFPRFSGAESRQWLRKCHKYFLFNPMNEIDKVLTAALHMEERADHWFAEYMEGNESMGWNRFSKMMITRFAVLEGDNLIGEFNKLQQAGSVQDYITKFEDLKAYMLVQLTFLSEKPW